MPRAFQLLAANGSQVVPLSGGEFGSHAISLAFTVAPTAGVVTIEQQLIGLSIWLPIANATAASITSGQLSVASDGAISALRVTFSGLFGGSAPTLFIATQPSAIPPLQLLTDGGVGHSARIRVDQGQTGFFAGRTFQASIEAVMPVAGPSIQFKFVSPVDFILRDQRLTITQGAVDLRIYQDATESGTWAAGNVYDVNRMAQRPQPYYSRQAQFLTGGNFTGGTQISAPILLRASAQNASAQNMDAQVSEQGRAASTYYGRIKTLTGGLTVNDAAQFVYTLVWEERPAGSY